MEAPTASDAAPEAEGAAPPERIWISPTAFMARSAHAVIYDEAGREPSDIEYIEKSVADAQVARLREALDGLRWMASVVYLHYYNRKDLDPVQQKHLELAIRNGAPFSDPAKNAAARKVLEETK